MVRECELEAAAFTDDEHLIVPLHTYLSRQDLHVLPVLLTALDALHRLEQLFKVTLCLIYEPHNDDNQLRADIKMAVSHLLDAISGSVSYWTNESAHETSFEFEKLLPHCQALKIMLDCGRDTTEMTYDNYTADMESIVSRVQANLSREKQRLEIRGPTMKPTFSSIGPLFFVATRCRNQRIRQRALEGLHRSLRRERKLTSCMAAALARFVVDYEEKASTKSGIPQSGRITLEQAVFSRLDHTIMISWKHAMDKSQLQHASLLYIPHIHADDGAFVMHMARKVLKASCYPGTLLMTPTILCHCPSEGATWDPSPVF